MLRFFLDASVIFAMGYSRTGASYELFVLARNEKIALLTSKYALDEVLRRVNTKYPERLQDFEELHEDKVLQIVESEETELDAAQLCVADPYDAPIIAAAKRAKADGLVSFDRKHLHTPSVEKYIGAPVITARDALEMLRNTP